MATYDTAVVGDRAAIAAGMSAAGIALLTDILTSTGDWVTAQAYTVNQLANEGGVAYVCTIAHTSGTFATDLAAGKWGVYQGETFDALVEERSLSTNLRNWLSAAADLPYRKLQNSDAISYLPRASGAVTAAQSGVTVTASSAFFEQGDQGRRIVFADGSEAIITATPASGSGVKNEVATVDRSQTISSQTFRIDGKGPCLTVEGDSISSGMWKEIITSLFRKYGFGGYVVSPLSDTTQSRIATTALAGEAAVSAGNFTLTPMGSLWSIPTSGSVTANINHGLSATNLSLPDGTQVTGFDLPHGERMTDTCTLCWVREAVTFDVQRKKLWDIDWETVEAAIDGSAGSGTLAWRRYKHALDEGWQYRAVPSSGTLRLAFMFFANRTSPGFQVWPLGLGGASVTNTNLISSATLAQMVELINPDLRSYAYADYGQIIGAGQTLTQAHTANLDLWTAAAPRTDTVFLGTWEADPAALSAPLNQNDLENADSRALAISRAQGYASFKVFYKDFATSKALGWNVDTIHATTKADRVGSTIVEWFLRLLSSPMGRSAADVHAYEVDANYLKLRGRDFGRDVRRSRSQAALKDRGASWKASNGGWLVGTIGAALGANDFTYSVKLTLPAANPTGAVEVGRITSSTANGNVAGSAAFTLSGDTIKIELRNSGNTVNYAYVFRGWKQFAGRTGWLTIRSNRARNNFELFFDTEFISPYMNATTTTAGLGETLNAWTGLGTNFPLMSCFNTADSLSIYGAALWLSALTDDQIAENVVSDRPVVGGTPEFHYTFDEGVGRRVRDSSGNGRHASFINGTGSSTYQLSNVTWLAPRQQLSPPVECTGFAAVTLLVNERAIAGHASLQTHTLPATPSLGDRVRVDGKGAGKWKIGQPDLHQVFDADGGTVGTNATTIGTGGSVAAGQRYDSIELECITSTAGVAYEWAVIGGRGTFAWV